MKIEEADNIPCDAERPLSELDERLIEAFNRIAFALGEIATAVSWVAGMLAVLAIATCAIAGAL